MRSDRDGCTGEGVFIAVVDDDDSVREALPPLLTEVGYAVIAFGSAEELMASADLDRIGCLILDIALPGMNGLDLHRALMGRGFRIPVLFITGQEDQAIRVRAFEQGAAGVLLKPFSDTGLIAALDTAFGPA